MANENPLAEWLQETGMVMRVCDGVVTFCDGDCKNCVEEDDE